MRSRTRSTLHSRHWKAAHDAQIATLTAQRDAARQELVAALATASKLVDAAAMELQAPGRSGDGWMAGQSVQVVSQIRNAPD